MVVLLWIEGPRVDARLPAHGRNGTLALSMRAGYSLETARPDGRVGTPDEVGEEIQAETGSRGGGDEPPI
jgi:hypothetical protein